MLRSGFFNSQNHDRMYNATDFNELISTIKSDGIDNYGDKLEVSAGTGLSVQVSTGKCFFNNHWLYNDNAYQIELEEASIVAPRIDAIVVEVNDTERDVFLKSVSGEPSNNPVPPTLIDSGSVHQHLLAYVNVPKEATSVGTITDKRSEWADVKSDKLDDVQDQITRNIENEETASRTYNVGEYIVRNGVYYKVTQTIVSGTAFNVGVNIEEKSVGEEITEINSNLTHNSFGTKITLTHNTNYICPCDGYFQIICSANNSYVSGYVNNVFLLNTFIPPSAISNSILAIFVRKGMTIKYTSSIANSNYGYFIPLQ